MDRRYLSQPEVIEASRKFVCVRLATYENKEEADFTKKLYRGFNREIHNTTFTFLSPNGKKPLIRPGRGPRFSFRNGRQMATSMNRMAESYTDQPAVGGPNGSLPKAADLRLGMNIASSDNLPLVMLYDEDPDKLQKLEKRIQTLAWSPDHIGKFLYVSTTMATDLKAIEGMKPGSGITVIQPDQFGRKGTALSQVEAGATDTAIKKALQTGSRIHRTYSKSMFSHIGAGQREGVFWTPVLPVTDPREARARERTKRRIEQLKKQP